jgi:NAD(P)-dependent dehydrogenase (short-subunit alcohol dehydrogenase family)
MELRLCPRRGAVWEDGRVSDLFVLRPEPLGGDPGEVTGALTGAFVAAREALEAGRPVVVVVAAGDLLGQGDPLDAAVATGLLGMVRTLAIEGAKPGWRINVVAGPGLAEDGEAEEFGVEAEDEAADEEDPVALIVGMLAESELTGQLLQAGGANLGKLPA